MPITKPSVDADAYATDATDVLETENENESPKVGTTVQAGWDAFDAITQKADQGGDYPTDFKFSEEPQLIKFIEDKPFASYEQHWIDGAPKKKSFVCIGDSCPLCDILGDQPRGKFAFNVLVVKGDVEGHQILTASPTLARQIKKAHDDERKGPLSKEFWEVSRMGTGPKTTYTLDYVRGRDLAEEWKVSLDEVNGKVTDVVPYTAEVVRETPRSEMLEVARTVA